MVCSRAVPGLQEVCGEGRKGWRHCLCACTQSCLGHVDGLQKVIAPFNRRTLFYNVLYRSRFNRCVAMWRRHWPLRAEETSDLQLWTSEIWAEHAAKKPRLQEDMYVSFCLVDHTFVAERFEDSVGGRILIRDEVRRQERQLRERCEMFRSEVEVWG